MSIQHTALIDQSKLVSLVNPSISWAQLERGKLDVGYRVVQVAPLVVSSRTVNLAVQLEADLQPGKTAVALIESPCPGNRWFGYEMDSETVAVCRDHLDLRTTGPSIASAIVIDQRELQSECPNSLDVSDVLESLERSGISRSPVAAARLSDVIRSVCSDERRPLRSVTSSVVIALAAALRPPKAYAIERSHAVNRRFSAVRICERYMREHLDSTITILDLSRACDMRSRTLINAFEAITGFSPMDYLKRLRLSAVHQALQRADRSSTRIVNVAMDWGFWHMGHFARDYRAMFGESPSRTLVK